MNGESTRLRQFVERESRQLAKARDRLARVLERNAPSGRSLGMAVGDRALTVDTEIIALALDAAGNAAEASDAVLCALAWQVKALRDLDSAARLRQGQHCPLDAEDARLLFDLASGSLLQAELSDVVARGERTLESRWVEVLLGLRHRVRQLLIELHEGLENSEVDRVDQIRAMIVASATRSRADARGVEGRGHRGAGRHPSKVVVGLCFALLVALLAHFAVNGADWLRRDPADVFSAADFRKLPEVIEIEDCPPSVLLTVKESAWGRMDQGARLNLLRESRSIVSRHAYTGVLVSTDRGAVVAQWATHSGDVLFEAGSEAH